MRHATAITLTLSLTLTQASCIGDLLWPPGPAVTIRLIPRDGRVVAIGRRLQIDAAGWSADGFETKVGRLTWTVDDPTLATVSSGGLVTGLAIGSPWIKGATKTDSDSVQIRVRTAICSDTGADNTLTLGASVSGQLDLTDCALATGPVADGWRLVVVVPTTVALRAVSADLEAAIVVTDIAMEALPTHDADYGRYAPSATRADSLFPGTYLVWATSRGVIEEGIYDLAVRTVTPCSLGTAVSGYVLGQVRVGSLLPSDCVLVDGRTADGQIVTAGARTFVGVEVLSADFPPISVMTNSLLQWSPATYELGHQETRSRQIFTLMPGTYALWATSAGDFFENGAYSLRARTLPICSPANTTRTVAVGGTVLDSLTLDDCVIDRTPVRLGELRALTLGAPTTLQIDLTRFPETDAELTLSVWSGSGTVVSVGLTNPTPTVTRAQRTFAAGTYYLVVHSGRGAGPYQLEVRQVP